MARQPNIGRVVIGSDPSASKTNSKGRDFLAFTFILVARRRYTNARPSQGNAHCYQDPAPTIRTEPEPGPDTPKHATLSPSVPGSSHRGPGTPSPWNARRHC